MNTWKVRHQGSPQAVEGVTFDQVAEGLNDGVWEPTDEVMGPTDEEWVTIENHPALADIAADLEPPPPKTYDDETRLDMTALIDVTLVLLIFFIILASYSALLKRLEAPQLTADGAGPAVVTEQQVAETMIHVVLKRENKKTTFQVEGTEVDPSRLTEAIKQYVNPGKTRLLLEYDASVPHGDTVKVQDAAKGAGMSKVLLLVPESELPPPAKR